MRGIKVLLWLLMLVAPFEMAPKTQAAVVVVVGVQPVCHFGYYSYAPYRCAPVGYYGPGYFHNGIFLGVGPWAHWGYANGWGSYRFVSSGGGHYYPHGGYHSGYPPHGHPPPPPGYRPPPPHGGYPPSGG